MSRAVLTMHLQQYALWGSGIYVGLFLVGSALVPLPPTLIYTGERFLQVVIFSAAWVGVMVFLYFLLARNIRVDGRSLLLHMGTITMLGPVCEVIFNNTAQYLFGEPLWVYHFLPVHNGDTSLYSFFLWAMYGCHLYFVDRAFIRTPALYRTILFALILSVDAIVLEFLVNVTSIYYLETYIFFYIPGDVQHLTTIAVVPFYFLGGIVAARTLEFFKTRPVLFGSLGFIAGFIFVFFLG